MRRLEKIIDDAQSCEWDYAYWEPSPQNTFIATYNPEHITLMEAALAEFAEEMEIEGRLAPGLDALTTYRQERGIIS